MWSIEKEERKTGSKNKYITIDNTSHEFYQLSLLLETKMLTPFDTQETDILKWEKQKILKGSEIVKW